MMQALSGDLSGVLLCQVLTSLISESLGTKTADLSSSVNHSGLTPKMILLVFFLEATLSYFYRFGSRRKRK